MKRLKHVAYLISGFAIFVAVWDSLNADESLKQRSDLQVVHGLVLDEKGTPVRGALVSPVGGKKVNGQQWRGRTLEVETCTTDTKGEFEMVLPEGMTAVDVEVLAEGFCGGHAEVLTPRTEVYEIVVPVGATISGKLNRKADTVANCNLAVVQMDRSSNRLFVKPKYCRTKIDGTFEFANLLPDQEYCIFSVLGDAIDSDIREVITTKRFRVPGSSEKRDLGTLQVTDPISIRGHIQPTDGTPLPDQFKLILQRNPAWDSISANVEKDGTFEIKGLTPETYEIRLGTPKIQLDADRLQYQSLSSQSFGVRVITSIDQLEIPVRQRE